MVIIGQSIGLQKNPYISLLFILNLQALKTHQPPPVIKRYSDFSRSGVGKHNVWAIHLFNPPIPVF